MEATRRGWIGAGASRGRWRPLLLLGLVLAMLGLPVDGTLPGDPVGAVSAQVDGTDAGPTGVLPADGRWTVTLLTGDVVDVRSDGEGRASVGVRGGSGPVTSRRMPNGDVYVTPIRVTPLLDQVLDLELFNVTGLVRQRYDDASSPVVPLIVERAPGVDLRARLSTAEGEQPLPSIGAVATELPKADARAAGELLGELSAQVDARSDSVAGIRRIWLDRRVTTESTAPVPSAAPARSAAPSGSAAPAGRPAAVLAPAPARQPQPALDANLTQVGADDAWAAGFTGEGARVAVLDTGVDAQHPDLAGKVVAAQGFGPHADAVDRHGHGTHVASIVAGSGAGAEGARRGVAPDAGLLVGKVIGDDGTGSESDVIAGMEWAAPQADVVNMSLGGFPSDGSDPLSLAVDQLSEQHGSLFVVAAGNYGPSPRTVTSPAAADRALAVGAVDTADAVAEFSSRGPLVDSNELKPEVVAPGVDIVAARAAGTAMGDPVDTDYTAASGTSMAAPHVAGAAAVLAQQHPDWSGDQLQRALIGSSDPVEAGGFDTGAGRVDVGDGVATPVRAERDVIDVALAHPRTAPHTEELSWTNAGDQPQTLTLDVELEDRRGEPVEAASVVPAQLTIPAGGTGTATIEIDAPALADGLYSGIVTAEVTGGDPGGGDGPGDVRTPIGVHAAPEMATLTIEAPPLPDDTDDLPYVEANIINLDDFERFASHEDFEGVSGSIEVPVGRYAVVGHVATGDVDSDIVAQVGDPDVTIDGDTTVVFDGSSAVPFQPRVEGVDAARSVATDVGITITPSTGTGGVGVEVHVYSWYPSPPVRVTEMEGDPTHVAVVSPVVRMQAPHITARRGQEPLEVATIDGAPSPSEGPHTWRAVDVGDGSGDLSVARGQLAVVQLPADRDEQVAITHRAKDAGVAALAYVDEARPVLTLVTDYSGTWAELATIAAGGESAAALRAAAVAGDDVTVTVTPSPYVYDLVLPESDGQGPHPVVDRSEQAELATLDERFHRDPDGTGAGNRSYDLRRLLREPSATELFVAGPLPERRTAYVTPGVGWMSTVAGYLLVDRNGELRPVRAGFSTIPDRSYASGSRHTLDWLRRPMVPGPVGAPLGWSFCQPEPVARSVDTLHVALTPFQDRRDRFSCNEPEQAALTLERDGVVIGTAPAYDAEFPVPEAPADYRLTYEQQGRSPYPHRSTTTWSFRSAGDPGAESTRIPLLIVEYDLPLDTLNRPTSRTATFTVDQVTGTDQRRIERLGVWTSIDDGTTWQRATVRRHRGGTFRVTLPDAAPGTSVALRVDARDVDGNRIEQTLHDAYRT